MVLALCAVLAIAVGFPAAPVAAQTAANRVTKAQATAVFRSLAPDNPPRVKIVPFAGSIYDGTHYCSLDWHTIMFTFVDGPSVSKPDVTRKDVKAAFDATTAAFTLDGTLLVTSQTPLTKLPDPARFGLTDGWFVNVGRVMSPESLSIGPHEIGVTIDDAANPAFSDGITFFIDAPGTGACLP